MKTLKLSIVTITVTAALFGCKTQSGEQGSSELLDTTGAYNLSGQRYTNGNTCLHFVDNDRAEMSSSYNGQDTYEAGSYTWDASKNAMDLQLYVPISGGIQLPGFVSRSATWNNDGSINFFDGSSQSTRMSKAFCQIKQPNNNVPTPTPTPIPIPIPIPTPGLSWKAFQSENVLVSYAHTSLTPVFVLSAVHSTSEIRVVSVCPISRLIVATIGNGALGYLKLKSQNSVNGGTESIFSSNIAGKRLDLTHTQIEFGNHGILQGAFCKVDLYKSL